MDKVKTIDLFARWGDLLQSKLDEEWDKVMLKPQHQNDRFTDICTKFTILNAGIID